MPKKNYIDNEEFEILIFKYKADPSRYGDEITVMLELLIFNIYKTWKFSIDIDDSRQDCLIAVLNAINKGNFKKYKGKAFSYFSSVIINELKTQYKKDKRYYEKLEEFRLFLYPNSRND